MKLSDENIRILDDVLQHATDIDYKPFMIGDLIQKFKPETQQNFLQGEYLICYNILSRWLIEGNFIEHDSIYSSGGGYVLTEKGILLRDLGYRKYLALEENKLLSEIKRQKWKDRKMRFDAHIGIYIAIAAFLLSLAIYFAPKHL